MEIISGKLKFKLNRGNNTETRFLSATPINDGSKHLISVIINETGFLISVNRTSVIELPGALPAHLSGPLFLGGVDSWTPAIKDDLSSDQSFYGCLEVWRFYLSIIACF